MRCVFLILALAAGCHGGHIYIKKTSPRGKTTKTKAKDCKVCSPAPDPHLFIQYHGTVCPGSRRERELLQCDHHPRARRDSRGPIVVCSRQVHQEADGEEGLADTDAVPGARPRGAPQ